MLELFDDVVDVFWVNGVCDVSFEVCFVGDRVDVIWLL
jgi:hypothetical protein